MLLKVSHTLTVDLNHLQGTWLLHEILGHHTHTRTYLEHGQIGKRFIHRIGYSLRDTQVSQEVLTEILFGSNLLHNAKV